MTPERQALAELVALKDLKERMERLESESCAPDQWDEFFRLEDEYLRRKPLAWAAARAVLAQAEGWKIIGYTSQFDLDYPFTYPNLGAQNGERCIPVYAAAPKEQP